MNGWSHFVHEEGIMLVDGRTSLSSIEGQNINLLLSCVSLHMTKILWMNHLIYKHIWGMGT